MKTDMPKSPTEDQVRKAVFESGLHQYAPTGILVTQWKDGIDIEEPSTYLMHFVKTLWENMKRQP